MPGYTVDFIVKQDKLFFADDAKEATLQAREILQLVHGKKFQILAVRPVETGSTLLIDRADWTP